jgi:hypothetical protein
MLRISISERENPERLAMATRSNLFPVQHRFVGRDVNPYLASTFQSSRAALFSSIRGICNRTTTDHHMGFFELMRNLESDKAHSM